MQLKCLSLHLLIAVLSAAVCQRFDFPSFLSRSPGLQVDGDGKVYTAGGSQLCRLNSNLVQEESLELKTDAVNISLSSDGRWLVVCLTDLSCEVYNASNFSAGSVFRRESTISSIGNVALFAAEDSFYVGGITISSIRPAKIDLGQYGFDGNQSSSASRSYIITENGFVRNFYGSGFIRGNNAYYFAVDNDPGTLRSFKVMRVCHNSDFGSLYELALICGRRPIGSSRISGLSVVDSFAGMSGPIVVLSVNQPLPNAHQNVVCLYNLDAINGRMQDKFDSCAAATNNTEQIKLSWGSKPYSCSADFSPTDRCHFGSSTPALDDKNNYTFRLEGDMRIDLSQLNANASASTNFITASAAAVVESFLLVFVGYTNENGASYISGFAINSTTTGALTEDQGFDRWTISGGPVRQIQIQSELGMVYTVTGTSVIQFPIAECTPHPDCTSCLGNGNPLCGWCMVEDKCSRASKCQNSDDSAQWIRAARTNTGQCPTISVSPELYVMDSPQTIMLTVSQDLPMLQENETYFCHFAGNEGVFTVPAVGSGTSYMCNITGSIPTQFGGLATVLNVSFVSSLYGIPFSTNVGGLTIYRCNETTSCSKCLQTNNACGWCVYNKLCSGTPAPCLSLNETGAFLQLDLAMGQTFTDVCPLLDQPSPGENYQQPVLIDRDIELITRNLLPSIGDFFYVCQVNGINLTATYNNETSLTCYVDTNTLILPDGVGQQSVDVSIRWAGQNIDHPIDAVTPVSVVLYSCTKLADGCSSCLGSQFECSWCGAPNQSSGSCVYSGSGGMCSATSITMGSDCAAPRIDNFNPKSGPPEGGTIITINGTNLGVSFDDFTSPGSSIQVGGVACTPSNPDDYMPGRKISCATMNSGGSLRSKFILITLPNGNVTSDTQFNVISPRITGVSPSRGPQAGGTQLTVYGTDLNIGNTEDTRITLVGGTECTVNRTTIQATNISCTTVALTTAFDPPMSGSVMVMIDSATVSDDSVQYNYTLNPEFYSVFPMNTILGGGIELTFIGTNLDVVENPVLVFDDPNYLNVTNSTSCTVINSTAISCVTPPLNQMQQPGDDDGISYIIQIDGASGPNPMVNASLQISVLPNPGNFELVDTEYNSGSNNVIRITGSNLDSVTADSFKVMVGGQICSELSVQEAQINCVPPSQPPDGNEQAAVIISIGQYISEPLNMSLRYITATSSEIPLVTIIPAVAGGILILVLFASLILCSVVCWYRRKVQIIKNDHGWTNMINQLELSNLQHKQGNQKLDNLDGMQIPENLVIASSQLKLFDKPIGQGEFGVVFKAHLINWQGDKLPKAVAVKTVKGLFGASDIEGLASEISKMKEFQHPNVMSLIGVCLDAGPGVSIVMPFMANGSLLDYLKKDRDKVYLPDTSELEDVLSVRKLLLRICHQIAKGMEYLALNKFVHRDLAARNCMLDIGGNVRVGDFGLAEDVYTRGYFRQGKDDAVKLPFKWMAPESLRDGLFSEKSDVWSFGITCWEVFSAGRMPYSGVDPMSMLKILESGTKLERPDNAACAPEIYSTVVKCWSLNPYDRPDFKQLEGKIGRLLNLVADYMELTMELLSTKESGEISRDGTIENSEMGEPNKAETYEDKPTFGAANSGYYMADDSAYRAAGSHNQSSGGVHDHLPQW